MIINTASASFLSHYLILNIAQQSGFLPQNVIWNFLMLKFILLELTLQAERHRDVWAPCILFGIVNDGDYLLHNCTILYQIFIDQPELLVLDIQRLWTYWHVPLADFLCLSFLGVSYYEYVGCGLRCPQMLLMLLRLMNLKYWLLKTFCCLSINLSLFLPTFFLALTPSGDILSHDIYYDNDNNNANNNSNNNDSIKVKIVNFG